MRKPYIVNKAGMAQLFGVSLKTVDDWIRKGAPVLKPGSNGVSYEIDSGPFVEWVRAHWAGISVGEFRKQEQKLDREFLEKQQIIKLKDKNRKLTSEVKALRAEVADLRREMLA
jgi:phage terminase Nu1 subunit (DNA packaging protein)